MIKLKNKNIGSIGSLRQAVQTAIELEHATIPPYLTANFTLVNTGNDEISKLIGSVVGEEMLHLSTACNLLIALGGHPVLNKPGFIPTYPGPLPGGVEKGLIVPIEKFSLELIKNVFMQIEEPEEPIDIKLLKSGSFDDHEEITIGLFYKKIEAAITDLEARAQANNTTIFTGNPKHQMVSEKWFKGELLAITDLDTAKKGIELIIEQGEGSSTDPFVASEDLAPGEAPEVAHYYRFEEIYMGKKLVVDKKGGYSFSGDAIPFDPSKIPNMYPNPKMDDYPVNSLAYVNSKLFNYNYTCLLNSLHDTFNGQPNKIDTAMGLMYAIRLYALKLLATPDPNNPGYVAGPSFEFVSTGDLTLEEKEIVDSHKAMA